MKRVLIAIGIMLIAASQGFAMDSLATYTWKNRVLVLFGAEKDPKLVEQLKLLRDRTDELTDRDMVILRVSGDSVVAIHGSAAGINAAKLAAEAGVKGAGFEAVLIGKDGGIKLRSAEVVSDKDLFGLIDSMPMRRAGQS